MGKFYWKWKSQIIDFSKLPKEKENKCCLYSPTKAEYIFHYIGIPDEKERVWENGRYSCEYNNAIQYAFEYGLVEKVED